MNKFAQGTIAGVAGIALLLGGAGTFALWNDSASIDASAIDSGTLAFGAESDGRWTNVTGGGSEAIKDISSFLIVPGNTLRFEQVVTITATGNDLVAELSYDEASITGSLKKWLDVAIAATSDNDNIVASGTPNVFTVTPVAGESAVTVVLTVELPKDTSGLDAQNLTLDLSALELTLQQLAIS